MEAGIQRVASARFPPKPLQKTVLQASKKSYMEVLFYTITSLVIRCKVHLMASIQSMQQLTPPYQKARNSYIKSLTFARIAPSCYLIKLLPFISFFSPNTETPKDIFPQLSFIDPFFVDLIQGWVQLETEIAIVLVLSLVSFLTLAGLPSTWSSF